VRIHAGVDLLSFSQSKTKKTQPHQKQMHWPFHFRPLAGFSVLPVFFFSLLSTPFEISGLFYETRGSSPTPCLFLSQLRARVVTNSLIFPPPPGFPYHIMNPFFRVDVRNAFILFYSFLSFLADSWSPQPSPFPPADSSPNVSLFPVSFRR